MPATPDTVMGTWFEALRNQGREDKISSGSSLNDIKPDFGRSQSGSVPAV
jgi:hypothetical protein